MKLTKLKKAFRKGVWSPEEDRKLVAYINRYDHVWNWSKMAEPAGLLRSGKSCRLRWMNYLKPGIKRGNYTSEEEETILRMHKVLGNKWSKIASALPGRTDNEIKNHWHTHLKKCLHNPLVKQTQSSNTSDDKNKFNFSELDLLNPTYDYPGVVIPPTVDGLCPYPNSISIASTVTSETAQKIEAGISLRSFWENLYLESLTKVSDESESLNYCCDLWEADPMSPFDMGNCKGSG